MLEISDIIPLDILSDRLLDIFRYFCIDTAPGPPSQIVIFDLEAGNLEENVEKICTLASVLDSRVDHVTCGRIFVGKILLYSR